MFLFRDATIEERRGKGRGERGEGGINQGFERQINGKSENRIEYREGWGEIKLKLQRKRRMRNRRRKRKLKGRIKRKERV